MSINTIGLVLDIIGVVLLFIKANPYSSGFFRFAPDEMFFTDGVFVEGKAEREDDHKKSCLINWQRIGITLIIIGFVLQIISNYI